MRYESPVPSAGPRWAAEDTEVNGVPIKKGEMVFLSWVAANGDPSVFAEPQRVDLDREPNRHIAFASGIHRCLGSHLARNELQVAIEQFHRRIPTYRVAEGESIAYEYAGVRQARRLPLEFTAAT
jgi:cytochrome P450